MNKTLLVGRLTRDPEINTTTSGIKYARITVAVNRPFDNDQADFVPVVAWRSSAEFLEKYVTKGTLVSIEGRFTSSTYTNAENKTVTRYEVSADRVNILQRSNNNNQQARSVNATNVITFAKENSEPKEEELNKVPWELEL